MTRQSDAEWEKFGQTDPYYGVLSQDRFRKDNLTEETLQAFFASGKDHIDFVFNTIRSFVDKDFAPARALDFGCGVGRCLIPLAQRCASATGLDVSDSMLKLAGQNLEKRGISNARLIKSDDELTAAQGPYDLVHSILVFQHIPTERGLLILEQLVSRLADRGVGALQFPYYRDMPKALQILGALRKHLPLVHNLANVLVEKKPFSEPLMEKNVYPVSRLLAILQRNQCGRVHIELQGRGKLLSVVLFFQKNSKWIPYEPFNEDE